MSKQILIVSEVFFPESGLVNDFAQQLISRGYGVEVLTLQPSYPTGVVFDGYSNDNYSTQMWNGIKIHRVKTIQGYRDSKIKKILKYFLHVVRANRVGLKIGGNFDHIIVYQTGPLSVALPAITIGRKFNIPITTWTFDIWPEAVYAYGFPRIFPITWLADSIVKKVYCNSKNVLVSSEMFAPIVRQYSACTNIDYAPNYHVPQIEQPSELNFDKSKFNFTFTGNISISQNLENVILGFVKAELIDCVLNIVGDGSMLEHLKMMVERQGIKGVVFHGRKPSNTIIDILNHSDMLILSLVSNPGIEKTEPFKLQSYLHSGKPIFGVIGGAGKEIIESNKLGICAVSDDIDQIAAKFCQAIKFAQEHSAIVAINSAKLLEHRFNREKIIDKVVLYIES